MREVVSGAGRRRVRILKAKASVSTGSIVISTASITDNKGDERRCDRYISMSKQNELYKQR